MASSCNSTQRRQKGLISEEDIASLLTKYSAPTILALLQEVAQFPDVKIDWNLLAKKTNTGITNAYEYQKLWRHLAYCNTLPETVEEKSKVQRLDDDDSDLEFELEAYPPVSDEASLEVAACVKVLLASGFSDDAGGGSATVETPLTINIPTCQDSKGLDTTVSNAGSQPAKRKRKLWTTEEDNELIAAVKKLGEGNWVEILKEDFKGDRTSAQLSKRWNRHLRKRNNVNLQTSGGFHDQAVSIALDKPMNNSLSAACAVSSANLVPAVKSQQIHLQTAPSLLPKGTSSFRAKRRVTSKKAASVVPNPMVQAAALAAGSRIATPSTAKSLLRAARSKKALHTSITSKSSMPGATPPLMHNRSGTRPDVHYTCTSLSSASATTYSSVSLPPAMKVKDSSVGALTTVSTSSGTIAACRMTNGVMNAEVENTLKEEKVQNSPKDDEVENSSKEVVKNSHIKSSSSEEVKNSSMEEEQV